MNFSPDDAVTAILAIPLGAAAVLALLPSYRLSAAVNMLAAFASLLAALSLFNGRIAPQSFLLIDGQSRDHS